MSRLGDRLRKLEEAEPECCDNCREWPDPFVVYDDSGKGSLDGVPERCPKCGYEPLVIIVRFTKEAGKL